MTGRARPVRRRSVLLGALACAALLAGVVLLAEGLRHPYPHEPPVPGDTADPRIEIVCEEPEPREGVPRDEAIARADEPPTATSDDLYHCPETWDGRRVRYEGEAIGGVLSRGDYAWVQLNDDVYSGVRGPLPAHRDYRGGNTGIGVALPAEVAATITTFGGPQGRGDLVEVVGTFHRVDPSTGEVAVVRASEVAVVRSGEAFVDARLRDREIAAAVLGLLALALVAVERRQAWQRRHGR